MASRTPAGMAPHDGIPLPTSLHAGAAVPAFPPSQVMARRAVRLGACRAMSRTPFVRGNLFREIAARASDDLDTVAVGPGQGSAAAVLLAAALGAGGRKGHDRAFRRQAVREHTGGIGRVPGSGPAAASWRPTDLRRYMPRSSSTGFGAGSIAFSVPDPRPGPRACPRLRSMAWPSPPDSRPFRWRPAPGSGRFPSRSRPVL